jgi:hypothetical protein
MRSFSKTFDSPFSLEAPKKIDGYRKMIDAV